MREAISQLAEQLRTGDRIGREAGERVALPSAVVIAGMGGSAMGGELLRALTTTHSPVPMTRVRGFGIPSWAGPGTLVVCVSYSGSTAETLACATRAHEQGADLLTIGAGGPLGDLAAEWGMPHALVPAGLQPRAALGYLFGAMAGAFGAAGLARDGIALQAAEAVDEVDPEEWRGLGERLAGTVPLVYGAGPMAAVAYRWKTQFNENAKIPAFASELPELDHNEIVGWEGAGGVFAAVMLRDESEQAQTRRMIEVTASLIEGDAAFVEHVWSPGSSVAGRAFSMVAIGDWVSYHAALVRGVDPTPVLRIGELKSRMG
jgi:glucose/mannose-6-phosphate isomerase